MMASSPFVRIGKIVGCHGLRGELKVRPTSEEAGWADTLEMVCLGESLEKMLGKPTGSQYAIEQVRYQGPIVLLKLQGVENRTQAESLVGLLLYAKAEELPDAEDGEFWVDDLIGLTVVDAQTGRERGTVKDLLVSGGTDFLEIQLEDGKQTVVIPFIDRFFPQVNLESKTISVDLLSDFLSLSSQPVTADRLEQ